MKKTLLLLAALGLAGAAKLTAGTVDVYITGSTAFRANVYTAATKLFASAPSIYYGSTARGGAGSCNSKDTSWCMTGTPITQLTNVYGGPANPPSSTTLVIHGLFTGSISGLKALENNQQLVFALPQGTINTNTTTTYTTNSPTLTFSDSDNAACPYLISGNYEQESVAVQPFVICTSKASNGVTNISNVSWEQLYYGIPNGRIPLSAWTGHITDTNWVYLCERTADSGTRRTLTANNFYQFTDSVGIYIYDNTNGNGWYAPTQLAPNVTPGTGLTYGDGVNGCIASGGYGFDGSANLQWGNGYVAGGDVKNTLNVTRADNLSIGCLSMSDSMGVGASNWATVVTFDGFWPTATGAGIHGNTGTNDYSPITSGYYPLWGYEVVAHPINPGLISDQDITQAQLGDWLTPGSFEGVFNAQTVNNGGSPLTGSIENEIQLSKTGSPGATAIRLSDMKSNRTSVGGEIFPF